MVTGLRRIAPACAGALVMVLAVGPARAADRQGTILSVDVAGKKLVVLDPQTSKNLDIGVSGQTQILTNAGKPLQLQDRKRGDTVGYTEVGGVAGSTRVNQGEL